MQTLSDRYIDTGCLLDAPNVSFSNHVFPTPDLAAMEHYGPMMPHLRDACPPLELFQKYKEFSSSTLIKPLNCTISKQQAGALRDRARSRSSMPLSIQDCLTAWVLDALGRAGGERLTKITNAASYRNVSAPFISPTECGNLIYIVPTETIDASDSFVAVAQKIRASLIAAREPKFIEEYMSVASHYMIKAAQKNAQFFWGGEQGVLSVNSHLSLDWNSAHFGSGPGHSRFFTTGTSKYYLRVFNANTDSTIFLSFGVPEDILQAFS
ncbi:hypothetical protein BDZ89DRAFT_819103 [Hymenopellis radicata]|nr:hypothetical protein BDZ89DRAFT_819103 [Hymenopellis radicata]